jgi:hypothetical protein
MSNSGPEEIGSGPAKVFAKRIVPGDRKGYTALPRAIYNLFGIEHFCRGIDNSLAVRLRHMRSPKRSRKADRKSELSFPPPFQQQAKYLSLADQFLAKTNGHVQRGELQAIDFSKHCRTRRRKQREGFFGSGLLLMDFSSLLGW